MLESDKMDSIRYVRSYRLIVFAPLQIMIFASWLLPSLSNAQESDTTRTPPAPGQLEFFETKIRPVLIKHCFECHSGEKDSIEGSLSLGSREGWSVGGDSGPALVPNRPDESLLIRALKYDTLKMPPEGKLPDAVIADFERWIREGAIDPRSKEAPKKPKIDPAAAASHWSFQPFGPPAIPSVATDWCQTTLDAFVLEKLYRLNWQPASQINDALWLRRVSLDLTGLPPTLDEIEAFEQSASPDKKQFVLDRLLASPQYGVRWGRHWLDLVRYADTNGADENHDMPNAWRYRDWVIDALNEDKPFDRFTMEQIAGDLLPPPDDETEAGKLLTATGLLVLGPKMLAEQDKAKMRIDIVDEQIDTLSKTFLGVTLACARCHDHKFDPFTQEDYFALAGILMSTRAMADEAFVSKWMERPLPSRDIELKRQEFQPRLEDAKKKLAELRKQANDELLASGKVKELPKKPESHYPEETKKRIESAEKELAEIEKAMPSFLMAMAVEDSKPTNLPIHIRGNHLQPGKETLPRTIPKILRNRSMDAIDADESGRLQLARWLVAPNQPLFARVMANRVWMWHFGQPLVGPPANFGLTGERPTHPELLDWLASFWMQSDWSLKRFHREILLSSTYGMRSDESRYQESDPENKMLWRMNRRRLEIEPLRDSMLYCSQRLDLRLGGPARQPNETRRTIYSKINRAALDDMLATFDYVEPANHIEQRPITVVPYQSLFFMNHPIVFQSGESISNHAIADTRASSDLEKLEKMFKALIGREPTIKEGAKCLQFLSEAVRLDEFHDVAILESERRAWAAIARTFLASSEFSWIP